MPPLVFSLADPSPPEASYDANWRYVFGVNRTPVGWPTTGLVSAIEVEATSTGEQYDGSTSMAVVSSYSLSAVPGAVNPAAGVWSGVPGSTGRYRTSNADAYYLDKFGGWRTDYLYLSRWSGVSIASTPSLDTTNLDIRMKLRRANWSAHEDPSRGKTFARRGVYRGTHEWGLYGYMGSLNAYAGGQTLNTTWAALGAVNGQWIWVRYTYNPTTGGTLWTSPDGGVSWAAHTPLSTTGTIGSLYRGTPNRLIELAMDEPNRELGMNGDLADFTFRDDTGDVVADLALSRMVSQSSTTWVNSFGTTVGYMVGNGAAYGAAVPATVRTRIDMERPFDVNDWRLVVDSSPGVTVDEVALDVVSASGFRHVGLVRGARG